MRIFVFGDSIAYGFYDTNGGWVGRIASELHQKSLESILKGDKSTYFEVYNLGISGDSTGGVLERIKQEVEARRLYEQEEIIIISVGINDSVLEDDNTALMDVYEFQTEYEKLIEEVKKLSDRVYCIGLTAVDEELTSPWTGSSTGKQWRNVRINLFEDSIKQSASRLSVPFIPIHDEFLDKINEGKKFLADGLHPNDAGHEFIAKTVISAIINNLPKE
jgi:lysophospholipase L1-like esterase